MKDNIKKRLRNISLGINNKDLFTSGVIGFDGALAGDTGHSLAQWLAIKFNHNFDAYDKAIDLTYNTTHIGGSNYHHLLDGQHSLWGAFKAVKHVNADDSWLTQMIQASEHLFRDMMSVAGINPFFSLTPHQFDTISNIVSNVGISKAYLADALTINGPELLGGSIALLTALIMGRKADPSTLSTFAGACLTSAFISANPMMLPIAAGAMAYAIWKSDDKRNIFINAGKGAIVSGTVFLISNLVGGPVWLGCTAGILTAIAVRKALDNPIEAFQRAIDIIKPAKKVFCEVSQHLGRL